jgi:predicted DNA-binding transcriptional regulator AlpA
MKTSLLRPVDPPTNRRDLACPRPQRGTKTIHELRSARSHNGVLFRFPVLAEPLPSLKCSVCRYDKLAIIGCRSTRQEMNPIDNSRPRTLVRKEVPLLYKISSVMELLQVSHATVYRLVANGELKLVKLSSRASRITSESVAKLLGKSDNQSTNVQD